MVSSLRRGVLRASACRVWPLLMGAVAFGLAACGPDGQPGLNAGQARGATVAFESIDGPPPEKFTRLVEDLDQEAKTRRLAVVSREQPSAFRVRGYLAVKVAKQSTTVSWLWDVFDRNERRALRISGEETAKGRHAHGWTAADDQMLKRIASTSMDQLAAFLTSPEAVPNSPALPQIALLGERNGSPEAAGIFRIFRSGSAPADEYPVETQAGPQDEARKPVPVPGQRPAASAASARKPVAVAASGDTSTH